MITRRTLGVLLAAALLAGPRPAAAGDTRLLLGQDYPPAALDAITRAATTVDLAMYFIILAPDHPDDPILPLVDALLAAHRRGVRVTVVVEDAKASENAQAVARLTAGGVLVRPDAPTTLLHAKALVVDERWVLVGSANWSRAAFAGNTEVSIALEDPSLAVPLAAAIRRWGRDPEPVSPPVTPEGVPVPLHWLRAGGPLSRMVQDRAALAFRLTLALQRDGVRPDPRDADAWRPYWRELTVSHARTQRKLRRRLTQDGVVGGEPRAVPESPPPTVPLPREFWTFGAARTLSPRAQLLYLAARAEALRSTRNPCWFRSQQDLAQALGISDVTVGLGLLELERENLIEVHRAEAQGPTPADRWANHYCVNPLIGPVARAAALAAVAARHPAVVRDARTIAASLNEPYDPRWLEALAVALERHGLPAVRRAWRRTLRRKPGSPARTPDALLRVVATGPRADEELLAPR